MTDVDLTKIKELAGLTKKWMEDIGAIHDEEKKKRGYITVEEWAQQFLVELDEDGNPTWKTNEIWQHVKLQMIMDGEPIAITQAKGHFLGRPGEQATNIIRNVRQGLALIARATLQWENVKESGRYLEVREQMRGKFNPLPAIGLMKATKGVFPDFHPPPPTEDLILLIEGTEKQKKDKL